ncbi:nuclear transport factor 2 family protein [Pantanalinema rosaneae CENA516]|uniref:nuclear transport factor 2 family protein n=1 Tax=Pantanalinema rosaneae TaxID=1620701 RepID=UPI003D6E4EA1
MTAESDVLAINHSFYRAFEKKDLEAMTTIWSHGTDCICIHPGRNALRGWEAIRSSWEKIFRGTAYLEIETEILRLEISGDLAYVVLTETVLQVAAGRQVRAVSIATNLFELMGGNWYLVHHHGSPIIS